MLGCSCKIHVRAVLTMMLCRHAGDDGYSVDTSLGVPLGPRQQQVLGNLIRVRALVTYQKERLQQERTNDFLSAASSGNVDRVKTVCYMHINAVGLLLG